MRCYVCKGACKKDVVHGLYTYWKCGNCTTSQVLPQPSNEELQKYYDLFHLTDEEGGLYDEVEDRMKADFPAKVDLVLNYTHSENLRLLDVGCGKGFFVKTAADANIQAEGIDISPSGIKYAINTLGVKATAGRIEQRDMHEWREAFDAVTLWATIEHLTDPLLVLQAINSCLKPGGVVFCDTGLGDVFWEKFLPGHCQWYDAPQHLFVFSQKGLAMLLENAGFKVVQVDTNFERSLPRRYLRWIRHVVLCVLGGFVITPFLGKRGLIKMRQEAKWPIGRLITVVARKMES